MILDCYSVVAKNLSSKNIAIKSVALVDFAYFSIVINNSPLSHSFKTNILLNIRVTNL